MLETPRADVEIQVVNLSLWRAFAIGFVATLGAVAAFVVAATLGGLFGAQLLAGMLGAFTR